MNERKRREERKKHREQNTNRKRANIVRFSLFCYLLLFRREKCNRSSFSYICLVYINLYIFRCIETFKSINAYRKRRKRRICEKERKKGYTERERESDKVIESY